MAHPRADTRRKEVSTDQARPPHHPTLEDAQHRWRHAGLRRRRRAAVVTVGLAQAFSRAGFDLTQHTLSLLSNGGLGRIQIANFVFSGALFVVAATGMRRVVTSGRAATWGPRLIAVYRRVLRLRRSLPQPRPARMGNLLGAHRRAAGRRRWSDLQRLAQRDRQSQLRYRGAAWLPVGLGAGRPTPCRGSGAGTAAIASVDQPQAGVRANRWLAHPTRNHDRRTIP
jgi:hypothetical protein